MSVKKFDANRGKSLTRDEIAGRREDIEALITDLMVSVLRHEQEIDVIRRKIVVLQDRDADLAKLDRDLAAAGMAELIRMCNTPCSRFVPANVDACEVLNG
jgi:hypothetical protein